MITASDILKAGILIVDDQPANVALLQDILHHAGYQSVDSTTEPGAVPELYRANRYDLILLDLQMPGMDGFEVMEALKKIETDGYLPLLVITAQPAHKLRALHAGARDFVSKPFELAELLMRVRNLIEIRLLQREAKLRTEQAEVRERELRVSELSYRRLFEAARDGIFILDVATGRITDVNPFLVNLLGFSHEDMLGKTVGELSPFRDFVSNQEMFERLQREGYVRYENLPLQTADGRHVDVEVVSNVYQAGGKKVIQCNVRDVTARKRAEVALRESEARYRALFEYAPDGIVIADPQSTYLDANPSICRMLGYTLDELIGLHASDIVVGTEVQQIGAALRVIEARSTYQREWNFLRKDGAVFPAEVIATKMPDGNLLAMIRDVTARKDAEWALAEKERLLHAADRRLAEILHGMTEACFALDEVWCFTFVNPRCETLLHCRVEDMLGRSIWSMFPQLAGTPAEAHYRRAMEQREAVAFEVFSTVAERWLDVRLFPSGDGMAAFLLDTTERKLARKTLELRERALSQISQGVLICDENRRITYANASFTSISGYTLEEVMGRTCSFLQGADTAPKTVAKIRVTLKAGKHFEGEILNYRKDGRAFWNDLSIAPIRDDQGGVLHFIGIQRDVTERKQRDEALRTSEQRFKALFDQAAVGVAQTAANTGRIVQINQRYCEILGYGPEELEQLTLAAITHPLDLERDRETFSQLEAGARREFTREKRYLRKDGSEVWANLTVSAMWAPGDPPDYLLSVAQDVTERKRLEEQFRQSQKMEAVGTLAGGIAHDFNNILASIVGYAEVSRLVLKDNPEVREYLGEMLQASSRATDLVRQIMAFSRQQRPERRPLQLLPVVKESLKLLRATLPSTIEFETAFAADLPTVFADPTQIHQVLMNLGTNAWHAMKDRPGRLQVKLERCVVDDAHAASQPSLRPGVYVRLSISDTGSGMDAATMRRIFEPFFTTKPTGEGTGLGLAVVHGIMESHEGVVTVYSQPGEGTVFHLYFPMHGGETMAAGPEEGPVPRGHGERILFVDDEQLLVKLGRITLVALGYEVEIATEPATALAMVRADPQRFALVITDQTMPGMTGLALAGQLLEIRRTLPIILMTGYSLALTPERIAAAGVRQLLLKPIGIHSLGAAVHAALSR
jgi:PAS domain S-box-containing protein